MLGDPDVPGASCVGLVDRLGADRVGELDGDEESGGRVAEGEELTPEP